MNAVQGINDFDVLSFQETSETKILGLEGSLFETIFLIGYLALISRSSIYFWDISWFQLICLKNADLAGVVYM